MGPFCFCEAAIAFKVLRSYLKLVVVYDHLSISIFSRNGEVCVSITRSHCAIQLKNCCMMLQQVIQFSLLCFFFAVTLKNAAELLEFSAMYNAEQLKLSCLQFIGLNMAALLEAR